MKKSLVLLGAVPVAFITALIFNPNVEEGVYQPRNSSNLHEASSADGALEYYHLLRGDYTQEEYHRALEEAAAMPTNRVDMTWWEHGPDNIGGRTRAILVDKDDINHIYAGSVSGGLFESINRANFWTPVEEFNDNLAISSMCQTVDGTIYVATGHEAEMSTGSQNAYDTGANGNGIYKENSDGTFSQISGTENFTYINEVVCDTLNNMIWFATNSGMRQYDPVADVVNTITNGLSSGECTSLSISPDGEVIVCSMANNGKTNVSVDGGVTFKDYSSPANTANPISSGASRIEYSISHEKADNGNYYIYASAANSFLQGIWMSEDNGINWTQIAPANNQIPGSFAPFSTGGGSSGQGEWNNIISAVKGNPKKLILGGIDLYSWATTGNWTQLSQWFLNPQSSQYVHADNHDLVWDKWGRLYIGNDGGISISDDGGQTFYPANRGYNVTQFYAIGASAHGDVIGGTQDNGSLANYHDNVTWHSFDEVGGGDGFSAEISFINRNVLFSSVYYSAIRRSADRGENSTLFVPSEFSMGGLGCIPGATGDSDGDGFNDGCGQFFTNFKLWENPNDLNSEDSISYVPSQSYSSGDTVYAPSQTVQTTIDYITPTDIVYDDTLDFNPGLTTQDSIITSTAPANDYNLAVFDYTITFGAHPLQAGDSVYLASLDTTIAVASVSLIDHYYGTNPLRPGKVYDMGNEDQAYGIAWDTLKIQDPYQSWMAIGLGGGDGIWMTRNALRFSAPSNEWFRVNHANIGTVATMEFSRDGNHLFIGTWSGALYRLSGFGSVYSPAKEDDVDNNIVADTLINADEVTDVNNLVTSWQNIGNFGAPVTGIAVEGDVDHVVVTLGNFGGSNKVQESTNATGASPSWTSISGNLPTGLPMYSVVIDRNDPNLIVVGADQGIYATDDGGTSWSNVSGDVGNTPIFDMRQNWRTYNEGCLRPGEIYVGTHGRGIWSSEDFLGLPSQQDNLETGKFVPNINVYPNPLTEQGTIAFELESATDVTIQIFNLRGQMIRNINETNVSAGVNNVTFGASDLPKGTYIIRLTAGDKVETTKFIKH
ncbi:MAG: T9SS type A sorting domain-containing protein [Crocinitomicaceae bacterium]